MGGASQGDTDPTNNFNVVYDICLDVLGDKLDYYFFKTAGNVFIPQLPNSFIDDWSSVHHTPQGAQMALQVHRTFGYPHKHLHILLVWQRGHVLESSLAPTLYAFAHNNQCINILRAQHSQLSRFLGAYLSGSDTPDVLKQMVKENSNQIVLTLSYKKTKPKILSRTIYSAVYPSLGYMFKFSNLTSAQLDSVSSPIHKLIRKNHHLQDFPYTVLFVGGSAPYESNQQSLTQYVNRSNYATYTRLNSINTHSKVVMNVLMSRTMRYLGAWDDPSNSITSCPTTQNRLKKTPTWGFSLIEWLEQSKIYPNLTYFLPSQVEATRTPIAKIDATHFTLPRKISSQTSPLLNFSSSKNYIRI